MTISDCKKRIAALANRDATLFTVDSYDNLLAAINDARRWAMRQYDFELLKTDVFLETSAGGANWITGCTDTPGGTALTMKRVDGIWNYQQVTIGGSAVYLRTAAIDFGNLSEFKRRLPLFDSTVVPANGQSSYTTRGQFGYIQGMKLFITNVITPTTYLVSGVQFLADLTNASSPDIFLTYFTDWLVYASLGAMNNFLKDSERFPYDTRIADKLWESVRVMDGQLASLGQSTSLD